MVPKLSEARELLKKYNKGDFHLLHGGIVTGMMGDFARQIEPEKVECWSAMGMLHDIDFEFAAGCCREDIIRGPVLIPWWRCWLA